MRELTEHVRAEPGNVVFWPYTRESRPNEYFVFEVYCDQAAFEEHIGPPTDANSTKNSRASSRATAQN